jgi:hypothetical protein
LLSLKDRILDKIIDELNTNLEEAYKEAYDKEIIGKHTDGTFINKFIDHQAKEFSSKNVEDHKVKEAIGDFFLNSFLFNVEMSKILNGDAAIYKDLFKRTYQSGSRTKFGNMGKPTINTLVVKDYKNIRSDLLKDENFLKSISTFSKEDQDFIKDAYSGVNATDAQTWISPAFWKAILISNAEWTKDHDELFEMLEGKVEVPDKFPEHYDELKRLKIKKKLRQPLD